MSTHAKYLNNKVYFMKDNRLLDPKARPIMMGWEDPIMRDAALLICKGGGKILNVGFGLGLIDTYIQSHNVDEHWIIEAHPDVQNKMKKDGWDKKSNVICLFDKWMEGIDPFHKIVPNILKPGGKYTYFSPTDLNVHSVFKSRKYKVQKYITKLDYIADNQNYYDKSNKNFTHRLITKIV
jgi:hypothetical protein